MTAGKTLEESGETELVEYVNSTCVQVQVQVSVCVETKKSQESFCSSVLSARYHWIYLTTMNPDKDITPEEQKGLKEFKTKIADVLPQFKHDFLRQDMGILRFLRARELNLSKSEDMLRKHLCWRKKNQVDDILDEKMPPHFFEDYPVKICGKDKKGYIVLAAQIGKWDFRGAVEAGLSEKFVWYVVQWFERIMDFLKDMSTKDKFYGQVCAIFDFEGFAYKQLASKAVITMLLELVQIFEANYPEILRVIWVINAPAVFNILWGIIKPFLTERTTSKIRIFGSNKGKWRPDMISMVHEDNIPAIFSGANTTCPNYTPGQKFDLKKLSPNFKTVLIEDMKSVHVGAGKSQSIEIRGAAGSQIHWNFSTENCDINFRVTYEDIEDVVESARVDSHLCIHKGTLTCGKSGAYNLVFDNSYSSFTGKTVRYLTWTS
ncbi:unnamed protein product [Allacma fusca]|uniref:CRAL-TRIO domain-containing protein n=1 Tax=Allacma fusca TaxID=39272 RepID=A0A8J2PUD1_9HEXA|nr:unnamed protein product [Allacma fusca]